MAKRPLTLEKAVKWWEQPPNDVPIHESAFRDSDGRRLTTSIYAQLATKAKFWEYAHITTTDAGEFIEGVLIEGRSVKQVIPTPRNP